MKFSSNTFFGLLLLGVFPALQGVAGEAPVKWSPVETYPAQTVYYPGTEKLQAHEMRVHVTEIDWKQINQLFYNKTA